jgi:hypothetical protein
MEGALRSAPFSFAGRCWPAAPGGWGDFDGMREQSCDMGFDRLEVDAQRDAASGTEGLVGFPIRDQDSGKLNRSWDWNCESPDEPERNFEGQDRLIGELACNALTAPCDTRNVVVR